MQKIIILSILIVFMSCGTGPWVTYRKNFDLYRLSVLNDAEPIRIDGIYVEEGKLRERHSFRQFYIFHDNGYYSEGSLLEDKWIDSSMLALERYINTHPVREYGLYSISRDSILIDYFGANPNTYYRWVTNYKGKVLTDSLLYMYRRETTLDNYEPKCFSLYFKFYPSDKVPAYRPVSWYLKRKWYKEGVHESRR